MDLYSDISTALVYAHANGGQRSMSIKFFMKEQIIYYVMDKASLFIHLKVHLFYK